MSAVRIEEKKLANPGAMHALAELEPGPPHGLVGQRQRTRESEVLVGLADRHHRQHKGGAIGRHQFDRTGDDTCIDRCIDPDRQMRSVLFDRADRKDCHDALRVEIAKILRGQIPPPMRFKDHA